MFYSLASPVLHPANSFFPREHDTNSIDNIITTAINKNQFIRPFIGPYLYSLIHINILYHTVALLIENVPKISFRIFRTEAPTCLNTVHILTNFIYKFNLLKKKSLHKKKKKKNYIAILTI